MYQHARKVTWLHLRFAFPRSYFEFEGAEWPSVLPEKCTVQHRAACQKLLYRQTSTKDCALWRETSFPCTLYCWITQVFSLFWRLLCWLSFSEATCLALESVNKVGDNVKDGCLLDPVTRCKMIHQFAPKCAQNNRNLIFSLLPLPFTNKYNGRSF